MFAGAGLPKHQCACVSSLVFNFTAYIFIFSKSERVTLTYGPFK